MGNGNNFTNKDIPCDPTDPDIGLSLKVLSLNNSQRMRFLASYNVICDTGIQSGYPTWEFLIQQETFGPYDLASIPSSLSLGSCPSPTGLSTINITETTSRLSWSAAAGAVSYQVRYRTFSGIWSIEIPVSGLFYDTSGLVLGTDYEWQVRSICVSGVSAWSPSGFFRTIGGTCGPLNGYTLVDIGSPSVPGTICEDSGEVTMVAAGDEIGGTSDSFSMAYQRMVGDGEMTIRINSIDGSDIGAVGGIMFRETLDADSRHASMLVEEDLDLNFTRRASTGGSTGNSGTTITFPIYLRLIRVGDNVTGHYSSDDISYTQLGPAPTIGTGANLYIGIVGSHDNPAGTVEVIGDSISLSGNTPEPICEIPSGLHSFDLSNDENTVAWEAATGALSYDVQYRQVGAGSWTGPTNTLTTSLTISPMAASTDYEWQVRTICASGTSGWSETGTFTTLASAPGLGGTIIDIREVNGNPLELEFSTPNGFTGSIQISATFHVVSNCLQQLKKTGSGGVIWKRPIANFTIGAGSGGGEYILTDTSSPNGCPSGITSWTWEITGGIEGTDWEFINGTNNMTQNPEIRLLKPVATLMISLLVMTACGQHKTQKDLLLKPIPEGRVEAGDFNNFVNGGYVDLDETASFAYKMYDGNGIPVVNGNADYYYRVRFKYLQNNEVFLDFWCRHSCDWKSATDESGTAGTDLVGNQVSVNFGDFFSANSLPQFITTAVMNHNAEFEVNKLEYMVANGLTCYIGSPLTKFMIWEMSVEMYLDNTSGNLDNASCFFPTKSGYPLRLQSFPAVGYDANTRSVFIIQTDNSIRFSIDDPLDSPVGRMFSSDEGQEGIASVLPDPDGGQPQIFVAPGPDLDPTWTDHKPIRFKPSGNYVWGSLECEEAPYWIKDSVFQAGTPVVAGIAVDPDPDHYINNEPIYWGNAGNNPAEIEIMYYDGADWIVLLTIPLTANIDGSQAVQGLEIDRAGRIWMLMDEEIIMLEYTGLNPTDPSLWVAGDFTQYHIAGDGTGSPPFTPPPETGANMRWTPAFNNKLVIGNYDANGLPIMYFNCVSTIIEIKHSGVGSLSSANWNFTTILGKNPSVGNVEGIGESASFFGMKEFVYIPSTHELIMTGLFGWIARANLTTKQVLFYKGVTDPFAPVPTSYLESLMY